MLLCGGVVLLRRSDVVSHPQLWAEDGPIFFTGADTIGWRALFMSYSGYYHALPRLIALFFSRVDPLWIPTVYLLSSYTATLLVLAALFSSRIQLPHKPWLALATVLVPHSGEVFLNITNIQWITAIGLILILMAAEAKSALQITFDLTATVLLGLTGPFVLLFWPLFFLRAILRRAAGSFALAAVASITAAIQLSALLHSPMEGAGNPFILSESIEIIAMRIWGVLLVGQQSVRNLPLYASALAGGLLAVILIFGELHSKECWWERMVLWGAVFLLALAVTLKFRSQMPILRFVELGDRYFFLPKVFVLWILFLQLSTTSKRFQKIVAVALIAIFLVNLPGFHFEYYADYSWPVYAAKIRAGQPVIVPLNPKGFVFLYPGRTVRSK